ncbi:MAG: hypothetical protein G01um101425_147 [Candidatus Peregrinibacteria bacterium Gr01-1014_25]|nr:MAG: hypothetical protein G01um101425_147 [Candidatus Peregrinibacteria bacterium Gr01-1014_25]
MNVGDGYRTENGVSPGPAPKLFLVFDEGAQWCMGDFNEASAESALQAAYAATKATKMPQVEQCPHFLGADQQLPCTRRVRVKP